MYHSMKKDPADTNIRHKPHMSFLMGGLLVLLILLLSALIGSYAFETYYEGKVYPNVSIDGVSFGGKTQEEVQQYWDSQNVPFEQSIFEFKFENEIATVSGTELSLGYDATLSATQAYAVGRTGSFFRDTVTKFFRGPVNLTPYFRWDSALVHSALDSLASHIDIPVQEALFQFENGRVTEFKESKDGRMVDKEEALNRFNAAVKSLPHAPLYHIVVNLPVLTIAPTVTTEKVNSYGIKELIGRGYSEYKASIPSRVHNVILAASRVNGVLIPPGETFSFNDTIGDISAATGYQSAYIIKDGRTVLGDGGGVCQVSSTLFRAALAAGLPIEERHAHAYRVHYYEEAGFKAGLDATVFSPGVDLKFKNDTPSYILIQTKADAEKRTLAFEFYGTHDGRSAEILNHTVYGESAPPPPLYQDDPTLPPGVTKQVDFASWGAKAKFDYKVTRGNDVLQDTTFYSNFRPWQAVFLRGPQI